MHAIPILIKRTNTNICFCLKLVWLVAKSNIFTWKKTKAYKKINTQYQWGEQQIISSRRPATCLWKTTLAKPSAVFPAMQTCTFLRCILKCTHTGLNFVSCGHDHLHSNGKSWGTAQCNPMGGPQNSASGLWCCVSKWHFFPLANPGKKKKRCVPWGNEVLSHTNTQPWLCCIASYMVLLEWGSTFAQTKRLPSASFGLDTLVLEGICLKK